jgi:hypothetical protein
LAEKINGIFLLEQFPEIINAGSDEQKAADRVGHILIGPRALHKDVDQEERGVTNKKSQDDLFGSFAIDHLP